MLKRSPMTLRLRLETLGLLVAGSAALGACSTRGTDDADPNRGHLDGPAPAGCAVGDVRYLALLGEGSEGPCADVAGRGGAWLAQPTFPQAPAALRDRACTYVWSAPASAPADVEALAKLATTFLTKGAEVAACEPPALELSPLLPDPDAASGPMGVTGCDVCGLVIDDEVFVVLPLDDVDRTWTLGVEMGDRLLSFTIEQPVHRAQAFSAKLPPAEGAEGYTGRVLLFQGAF